MMRQLAITSLLVAGLALAGGAFAQSSTAPKTASTSTSTTKTHKAHHGHHHKAHKKGGSSTGG